MLDAMPARELKSFDRVASVYDETRSAPPVVAEAVTRALLDVLRENGASRLLEVGIGTGRIACPLADGGVRVTGIDISPKMLAVLRAKTRAIDVVLSEAAHPPFQNGSFDAALFVHILHLIPQPAAMIEATLNLLRRPGVVIIGTEDDPPVQNIVDEIITNAKRQIAGVDDEARDAEAKARGDALMSAVEARGGSVSRRKVVSWAHTTTVGEMLERQARRDYSSSWSMPEAAHTAFIDRLKQEFAELPGGLSGEVRHEQSFALIIGCLPSRLSP
jgi:ubiquinone/menaquinone biosynthesis C-methylase UbiE